MAEEQLNVSSVLLETRYASIVWSVIWFIFVSNNPTSDHWMLESERQLFKRCLSERPVRKKIRIPWRAIFTSMPFWAFMNEFLTFYRTQSFFFTGLPLFVKDSYDVSIQSIGIISGLPMITAVAGLMLSGLLSDYLRNHSTFKKSTIHRIFVATGQISFVIGFVYCGIWANFEQSIISFTLIRLFAETSEMTYKYLCLFFPLFPTKRSSLRLYFLILSIFNIWGLIIFYFYGSGELQEWAVPNDENETPKNESEDKNVESSR